MHPLVGVTKQFSLRETGEVCLLLHKYMQQNSCLLVNNFFEKMAKDIANLAIVHATYWKENRTPKMILHLFVC